MGGIKQHTGDKETGVDSRRVPFKSEQRQRIRDALNRYLRIDDLTLQDDILDEIAKTAAIRTFGYGSLIHTPHTQVDRLISARLQGWGRGFVVYDPFYRGTPESPGLTLGLEPDENGHTDGAMLENTYAASDSCPQKFSEMIVDYLYRLSIREMPVAEPLYRFELVPVTLDDGTRHLALACVADSQSPLYVGRAMSLEERAAIIARSYGYGAASERIDENRLTNLDYIRKCIHATLEMGDVPCPRMMELLRRANKARREMDDDIRADLDALESKDYHPSVYR